MLTSSYFNIFGNVFCKYFLWLLLVVMSYNHSNIYLKVTQEIIFKHVSWSYSHTNAIHHFNHRNRIWYSTRISILCTKYLNTQTEILALISLKYPRILIFHRMECQACQYKHPNANMNILTWWWPSYELLITPEHSLLLLGKDACNSWKHHHSYVNVLSKWMYI
jgi:hypothetical protein